MGKKKWQRVRLTDLASQEEQEKVLGMIGRVTESQAENSRNRGPETPQEGQSGGRTGVTPHQESGT